MTSTWRKRPSNTVDRYQVVASGTVSCNRYLYLLPVTGYGYRITCVCTCNERNRHTVAATSYRLPLVAFASPLSSSFLQLFALLPASRRRTTVFNGFARNQLTDIDAVATCAAAAPHRIFDVTPAAIPPGACPPNVYFCERRKNITNERDDPCQIPHTGWVFTFFPAIRDIRIRRTTGMKFKNNMYSRLYGGLPVTRFRSRLFAEDTCNLST